MPRLWRQTYVVAKTHTFASPEEFCVHLCNFFLDKYPFVRAVPPIVLHWASHLLLHVHIPRRRGLVLDPADEDLGSWRGGDLGSGSH